MSILRTNTDQTTYTGTTHQIHQQSFNTIITMVCDRNSLSIQFDAHLFKPIITQLACRHLYGYPILFCKQGCWEINSIKRHSFFFSVCLGKTFISFRFFSPQMEITMQSNAIISQSAQNIKQRNRICTST